MWACFHFSWVISRSGNAGSPCDSMSHLFRNCQTVFQVAARFYTPNSSIKEIAYFYISTNLLNIWLIDSWILLPASLFNLLQTIVLVGYMKKIHIQRDTKLKKEETFIALLYIKVLLINRKRTSVEKLRNPNKVCTNNNFLVVISVPWLRKMLALGEGGWVGWYRHSMYYPGIPFANLKLFQNKC